MTVKADVTSTLNGQSADLILIEDGDTRSYESKTLSGGTETFIFTGLDGGEDKEYTAKIVPSTTDVTQTAEIGYDTEIRIDPIPHRDVDATSTIRETAEFNNGVAAKQLGLGDNPLINGLLTSALNDGEVLADDGYVYSTVQAAQDAASSWIFIGPGTFSEAVTIDTAGLKVVGSGYNTLIDGGTTGPAVNITAVDVSISDLSLLTTAGAGNSYHTIDASNSTSDNFTIQNVTIRDSDEAGVVTESPDGAIIDCTFEATDEAAIRPNAGATRTVVVGCVFRDTDNCVDIRADDVMVANNVMDIVGFGKGVALRSNDCLVGGNRISAPNDDGIVTNASTNSLVFNNRVNAGNTAIDMSSGSGYITDGNNTGASN